MRGKGGPLKPVGWIQSVGLGSEQSDGPSWKKRASARPETQSSSLRIRRNRSCRTDDSGPQGDRPRQRLISTLLFAHSSLSSSCRPCMQARPATPGRTRPRITSTGASVQTTRALVVTRQSIRFRDAIVDLRVLPRSGESGHRRPTVIRRRNGQRTRALERDRLPSQKPRRSRQDCRMQACKLQYASAGRGHLRGPSVAMHASSARPLRRDILKSLRPSLRLRASTSGPSSPFEEARTSLGRGS